LPARHTRLLTNICHHARKLAHASTASIFRC
jgi:hypothetical protein